MPKLLIRQLSLPMIGFLAFFTITFVFYFLYLLGLDTLEKYVPVITATVALYTPFGAWKIAEKWRDQKKYDLLQKQALEILADLNQIHFDSLTMYNLSNKFLKNVENGYIYLSDDELKLIKDIVFIKTFSKIFINLDTYLYILPEDKREDIDWLKNEINCLCSSADQVKNGFYQEYWKEIEVIKNHLKNDKTVLLDFKIEDMPDVYKSICGDLNYPKNLNKFLSKEQTFQYHIQNGEEIFHSTSRASPNDIFRNLKNKISPFKDLILEASNLDKLK